MRLFWRAAIDAFSAGITIGRDAMPHSLAKRRLCIPIARVPRRRSLIRAVHAIVMLVGEDAEAMVIYDRLVAFN
jgi:hypothetical protein